MVTNVPFNRATNAPFGNLISIVLKADHRPAHLMIEEKSFFFTFEHFFAFLARRRPHTGQNFRRFSKSPSKKTLHRKRFLGGNRFSLRWNTFVRKVFASRRQHTGKNFGQFSKICPRKNVPTTIIF